MRLYFIIASLSVTAALPASAQILDGRGSTPRSAAPVGAEVSLLAYQFDPPTWEMLDNILFEDSLGWVANVYVSGSIRDITLLSGSYRSGYWSARAYYTFSNRLLGGRHPGWVVFHVQNGRIHCLEFHDMGGQCRAANRR